MSIYRPMPRRIAKAPEVPVVGLVSTYAFDETSGAVLNAVGAGPNGAYVGTWQDYETDTLVGAPAPPAGQLLPSFSNLRPHVPLTAPNLVVDPGVTGLTNWSVSGTGGGYDAGVTRTADGSGSLYFDNVWVEAGNVDVGQNRVNDAAIMLSDPITVTPGQTYTFSLYARANFFPYNLALSLAQNVGGNTQAEFWAGSAVDTWEECIFIYTAPAGVTSVQLRFLRRWSDTPEPVGRLHVDDLYFGLGVGTREAPSAKVAFSGARSDMDELGNLTFDFEDGSGKVPYFPMTIYRTPASEGTETPLSTISNLGFTGEARASSTFFDDNRAATSAYNSEGLRPMFATFGFHLDNANPQATKVANYESSLTALYNNDPNAQSRWYWDDEMPEWYSDAVAMKAAQDAFDPDTTAIPQYVLAGNQGRARAIQTIADLVGTYAFEPRYPGNPGGLFEIDRTEGFTVPAAIAQIQADSLPADPAGHMRRSIYNAITVGARGMNIWRDGGPSNVAGTPDVATAPWNADIGRIRDELDGDLVGSKGPLIDLIRTQHWTPWEGDVGVNVLLGSAGWGFRQMAPGHGYIIIINQSTDNSCQVQINLATFETNQNYPVLELENWFDLAITPVAGSVATITIPATSSTEGVRILRFVPNF